MLRLLVTIGFALALAPGGAFAGDYTSGFGIGISVPDVYLVLTRDEVRENAAFFVEDEASERFDAIPAPMRRELYDRVRTGQLEIFYRTEDVDLSFVDNVNIMKQRAELPSGAAELREVCELLPAEFSRVFGRPIGLDGCEMRVVADRPALYLAFDGALPGTKTLQYQIRKAPGETLIVTATARESNLPRMMGEFESMVASIRMR
jgi:hypothetical protein